jgi:hypothetical protein
MPGLADAMAAIDGLRLDCRVPPRVQQEHLFGRGQVESQAAGSGA